MIGSTLGHYRIDARLGAGGMGTVYRAYDLELHRPVALKILTDELGHANRSHLLREGRAASGLNHPHICTVHEVAEADGHAFLVMEYVQGRTLTDLIASAGLPASTVIRYGTQIGSALAHAHEHGVIHRDLKPSNVIVTPEGSAKVLDFGIARRLTMDLDAATETQPGSDPSDHVAGTLAYMAPEVLQGNNADARSDVWSLGVLLFEMTAGRRPYSGRTSFELVSTILRDEPPALPASVPGGLSAVIHRCLSREPERRYQRGGEVHAALEAMSSSAAHSPTIGTTAFVRRRTLTRWLLPAGALVLLAVVSLAANVGGVRSRLFGTPAEPTIRSIAVLPLDNLSGDPAQDYFADGMTEALITNLARIGTLRVISRTSIMRYKDTPKSLTEIARELGVDAVVEGSVQRASNHVRITAQLIHAATDSHLWAREYDSEIADTLKLQADVARAIANEIRVQLTPQEEARLARTRSVNPDAYDAYLRGRYHRLRLNETDLKQSIAHFERAVAIDPQYAAAYAGLADAWSERGVWGALDFREVEAPQRAAAEKALALDDSLAEVHAAIGHVKYVRDWDWAAAERHFRRALELDPGSVDAHHYFAVCLMALGRHEEAIAHIQKAVDADPLSSTFHSSHGRILYRARRYADAIREYERALELDPVNFAYGRLVDAYELSGQLDQALTTVKKIRGGPREAPLLLARLHARSGRRGEARAIISKLIDSPGEVRPGPAIAGAYAALGEEDRAYAWLHRAIDERQLVVFIKTEPTLDPLRDDPRWPVLLKRINLTP